MAEAITAGELRRIFRGEAACSDTNLATTMALNLIASDQRALEGLAEVISKSFGSGVADGPYTVVRAQTGGWVVVGQAGYVYGLFILEGDANKRCAKLNEEFAANGEGSSRGT